MGREAKIKFYKASSALRAQNKKMIWSPLTKS